MIATATADRQLRYNESDLTDQETIDLFYWIDELKRRNRSNDWIATCLDLSASYLSRIRNGKRKMSRAKFTELKALFEKETTMPTPRLAVVPAQETRTTSSTSDQGILGDLGKLRKQLTASADLARRMADVAIPLLKPGLQQTASRIDAVVRDLEI